MHAQTERQDRETLNIPLDATIKYIDITRATKPLMKEARDNNDKEQEQKINLAKDRLCELYPQFPGGIGLIEVEEQK